MTTEYPGTPYYIASANTYQVKAGPGVLKQINITETAAAAITVYDDPAATTANVVALFKASIVEGAYRFDCAMRSGIKVVTAGASRLTVVYE